MVKLSLNLYMTVQSWLTANNVHKWKQVSSHLLRLSAFKVKMVKGHVFVICRAWTNKIKPFSNYPIKHTKTENSPSVLNIFYKTIYFSISCISIISIINIYFNSWFYLTLTTLIHIGTFERASLKKIHLQSRGVVTESTISGKLGHTHQSNLDPLLVNESHALWTTHQWTSSLCVISLWPSCLHSSHTLLSCLTGNQLFKCPPSPYQ